MLSLGIDTSCYTTSLVVMDGKNVVYEGRKLLTVKKGTVGLRQADAFFQHVQNLPILYKEMVYKIDVREIDRIVVSDRPRPLEGSYMPVFTAGMRFAEVIGDTLDTQVLYLSHQENHLYATLLEHGVQGNFVGVHISGGTSEILAVDSDLSISIIGETLDLSFGKLIDRLGVYMGLDFPCGQAMDIYTSSEVYPLKMSIKDMSFNISGIENQLKAYYDKEGSIEKVSVTLFRYIGKLLCKVLKKALDETNYDRIIMSGGVSANKLIREEVSSLSDKVLFTSIEYSTDHAVGNAYYGNVVRSSN
ncbi:peptidase M22 [Acidaminobacter sp. JC074]|uniref:Kae1-like domain-containing protein n=1 Tax=Acidaminobacter sp. JC074 TaxID=2530199 RepID=UPI001F0FB4EE|nr:peptidase M22 [Acidaminobacter sp. JC074]MCH4888821.1 peptidase M22 [Acidaminobacter sp. JC074]